MKDIFLIRHGRQCSKLCNVDVELDEIGRRQAELLGKRLKSYGLEKLYSSELLRAKETAEIINETLDLPYEVLPDIQEINFGGFTGKTDEEIREQYADFRKERSLHRADLPYPEGGECGEDVAERVMPQLTRLCKRPENRIGIVTHGGVIRSVCARLLETDQKNKLKFAIDLENASLTHLIYDATRNLFFLERFNDFAHLEGKPELLRSGWKTSLERP
ncbi:MAG: histidine phosphatase family protein [Lachnospiraceae bacterium]|nr:histidine phosphatase family protein [Lachnospiraceae bacterium]